MHSARKNNWVSTLHVNRKRKPFEKSTEAANEGGKMRVGFHSPGKIMPFSGVAIFRTKVIEMKIKFRNYKFYLMGYR